MIVNEGGKKLPKLTTPGTSADLLTGKELIDQYGRKIEGSMPINSNEVPMFDTTELEESGRLRARAIYRKGFYNGGNSGASYYLPTQAGAIITPGTETITAVPSGKYTLGAVEVAGDSNLVPENIANGRNIFGVSGSYQGEYTRAHVTSVRYASMETIFLDTNVPLRSRIYGSVILKEPNYFGGGNIVHIFTFNKVDPVLSTFSEFLGYYVRYSQNETKIFTIQPVWIALYETAIRIDLPSSIWQFDSNIALYDPYYDEAEFDPGNYQNGDNGFTIFTCD